MPRSGSRRAADDHVLGVLGRGLAEGTHVVHRLEDVLPEEEVSSGQPVLNQQPSEDAYPRWSSIGPDEVIGGL
jgi:hypothetical protein